MLDQSAAYRARRDHEKLARQGFKLADKLRA